MQFQNSRNYIWPFVAAHKKLDRESKVLEIGSAEGGVLKAFTDHDISCVGIELSESRVELANTFMKEEVKKGLVKFVASDIYDINPAIDTDFQFDLIILKDVIEHIHDQEKFMNHLHKFMKPEALVFFGFPPWYMPWGGHQQVCNNKWLSKLPYYHLLPNLLYKTLLKWGGESQGTIEGLLEIKETGISIERFQGIVKKNKYSVLAKIDYLINPIYELKFGMRPRKSPALLKYIPYLRNFYTSCMYYLIREKEE